MVQALAFTAIASIVSTGISYAFPSDGPRLKDIKISASTYGNIIPEGFGASRVAGNMIWASEVRETKTKKQAGKGGSFYNQYTYDADFSFAFCLGPIDEFRRVWADGKLIYDTTGSSEVESAGKFNIRLYLGDEVQIPDPTIERALGVGKAPAFRGLAYIHFDNFQLADFGNRIPQFAAEIYRGVHGDADYTNVTHLDATDPLVISDASKVLFDFDRGYFYARTTDSNTSPQTEFLSKYRVSDAKEIAKTPMRLQHLLAQASDGGMIIDNCAVTSSNFTTISRLSASLEVLDSFGVPSGLGDPVHPELYVSHSTGGGSCARDGSTNEYYLHHGIFGDMTIFQLTKPTLVTGAGLAYRWGSHLWDDGYRIDSGYPPGEARFFCPREPAPAQTSPIWYCLHGGEVNGDGNLYLKRIDLNGFHDLLTIPLAPGTANTGSAQPIFWDSGSGGVLFFYTDNDNVLHLAKWSETDGVVWDQPAPGSPQFRPSVARIDNGVYAYTTNNRIYKIDTRTGEWINKDDPASYFEYDDDELSLEDVGKPPTAEGFQINDTHTNTSMQVYDSRRNIILGMGGTLGGSKDRVLYVGGRSPTTLGAIVEALLRRTGLRGGDFDLAELYEIDVPGYAYASATDVKSLLSELRTIYLFDLVETNGMLVARVRGDETADETINALVLGNVEDSRADFWKETRAEEADLPMQITIVYTNVDDDFEQSTARAKRIQNPTPSMYSKQIMSLETNLILEPSDAKTRVHRMLYTQWGERTRHDSRMPWAYAYLDPSDLINVNFPDGRQYFERIHHTEIGADFSIDIETFSQDTGAYTTVKVGDGGGSGRTQTIPIPKPAQAFIMNTPLLRDTDDSGGTSSRYYAALGKDGDGSFVGATLYRSINSEDYSALYSENNEAEWGLVRGVLPPPSHGPWALDWETRLTVTPMSTTFELESIGEDLMAASGNLCVVGNEVIQFKDCVENEDGSWTLWNLYRGRRGTQYACDTHGAGERFLFLDTNTVEPLSESLDAAGAYRWFKGVGYGRSLNETDALKITYAPRDLMPYAPTGIERTIDLSGATITWKRRTRIAGGLLNGTGAVPLGEASEEYQVYILSGPFNGDPSMPALPNNILHTSTTTHSILYTTEQMGEDGFDSNVDTIHVVVYQLSAAVGRGFPGYRSIEAWRDS